MKLRETIYNRQLILLLYEGTRVIEMVVLQEER